MFGRLGAIGVYALVELGGPVGVTIGDLLPGRRLALSAELGAIGAALFAFSGWRMLRRRDDQPPARAATFALCAFAFGMVLLTAIGRVNFGPGQALASRYQTPVIVFWLTLVLFGASGREPTARMRTGLMLLALPLQVLLVTSEAQFVAVARGATAVRNWVIPAVLANVADGQILAVTYPDPPTPLARRPLLVAARTSVFADAWSTWLGTPLRAHVTVTPGGCVGEFGATRRVADTPTPGWRATGWVRLAKSRQAHPRILLASAAGEVIGYGLGGQDLRRLTGKIPAGGALDHEWIGAFSGRDPTGVTAFALMDDGHTTCRIGEALAVLPEAIYAPVSPANQPGKPRSQ